MIAPAFTVCIPHYHAPQYTRALNVCLTCLAENTVADYDLLVYAQHDEPYGAFNRMAEQARTEYLMFLSTDQFVQPAWDVIAMQYASPSVLLAFGIVESGYSPSHEANEVMDFGQTPEAYQRTAFEAYASEHTPLDVLTWAFPYFVNRDAFLRVRFPAYPFLSSSWMVSDKLFFDAWLDAGNTTRRIPAYVYHLMRWTSREVAP